MGRRSTWALSSYPTGSDVVAVEEPEIRGEARCSPMVEQVDADLLKDLRGLGKPPTFDEIDAEYQNFPFSFRIHMSLVTSVSQKLMDKCEAEWKHVALAALGGASLTCCIQMYCSPALITKGGVRTLVRSVEESNGAEAWRLLHRRYAPDTQQNRQYALMQKIMIPAKPWCDHAEGFESGLRAWENGNVLQELLLRMQSSTQ